MKTIEDFNHTFAKIMDEKCTGNTFEDCHEFYKAGYEANQTEVNRWRSLAEQRLMRVEELERNHTESTVDAWGAYHQADGLATSTISLSKTFCENRLLRYYYDFDKNYNAFARAEAYYAARDIGLIRATKDNWKIVRIEIRQQDSEE